MTAATTASALTSFADAIRTNISTVIIDRPDQPMWGAGEMVTSVVSAAVGNAVFDATGARLRHAPFTPERVKAALAAA